MRIPTSDEDKDGARASPVDRVDRMRRGNQWRAFVRSMFDSRLILGRGMQDRNYRLVIALHPSVHPSIERHLPKHRGQVI